MRTITLHSYSEFDMQAYARACIAHATAAKDAEIEALRAEVAHAVAGMNAALGKVIEHRNARHDAEAHAERLAEELLESREDAERYRCLRAQNVIAVTSHDQSVEYQLDDLDAEVDRIRRDQ